jgi:hypothetical protein
MIECMADGELEEPETDKSESIEPETNGSNRSDEINGQTRR